MVVSVAIGHRNTKRKAMQDTRTGTSTVPSRMVQAQRQALKWVCCMKGLSTAGGYKEDLLALQLVLLSNTSNSVVSVLSLPSDR